MQHSCETVKKSPSQVASHFWELASKNTKQIFDVVPGDFLPQFKNPCFWETYTPRRDPYAGSPYAPKVGETYKYDPWGHTGYYKRARDRFPGHLQHNKTTNQYKRKVIPCNTSATKVVKNVHMMIMYWKTSLLALFLSDFNAKKRYDNPVEPAE